MRISTFRATAIAAAAVAMMGSFATGASADIQRAGERARASGGIIAQSANRGRNFENRNFSNRSLSNRNFNRSSRNYQGSRRYYGNNFYGNGYGRSYRGRGYGNNGFGIYLNLGDNGSGCNSYYRKWRAYGSSYWRNRYYDCVG
jgi:hypothetical protein